MSELPQLAAWARWTCSLVSTLKKSCDAPARREKSREGWGKRFAPKAYVSYILIVPVKDGVGGAQERRAEDVRGRVGHDGGILDGEVAVGGAAVDKGLDEVLVRGLDGLAAVEAEGEAAALLARGAVDEAGAFPHGALDVGADVGGHALGQQDVAGAGVEVRDEVPVGDVVVLGRRLGARGSEGDGIHLNPVAEKGKGGYKLAKQEPRARKRRVGIYLYWVCVWPLENLTCCDTKLTAESEPENLDLSTPPKISEPVVLSKSRRSKLNARLAMTPCFAMLESIREYGYSGVVLKPAAEGPMPRIPSSRG